MIRNGIGVGVGVGSVESIGIGSVNVGRGSGTSGKTRPHPLVGAPISIDNRLARVGSRIGVAGNGVGAGAGAARTGIGDVRPICTPGAISALKRRTPTTRTITHRGSRASIFQWYMWIPVTGCGCRIDVAASGQ